MNAETALDHLKENAWVRPSNYVGKDWTGYFAIVSKYIASAASIIFRMLSVFHLDFNLIILHAPVKVKSNFPFCFRDNTASLVAFREMHFLIAFIFTLETVLDHLEFANHQ